MADYPLHPGQTHAEPYYCTIPLEEYEKLKNAHRWRKVSEELPEYGKSVLVADAFGLEDSVTMARYTNEGWELNSGALIKKDWFTYWIPLPEPPEVKQ